MGMFWVERVTCGMRALRMIDMVSALGFRNWLMRPRSPQQTHHKNPSNITKIDIEIISLSNRIHPSLMDRKSVFIKKHDIHLWKCPSHPFYSPYQIITSLKLTACAEPSSSRPPHLATNYIDVEDIS